MIPNILYFFHSHLQIRVSGSQAMRFLNLCMSHKLLLTDITIEDPGRFICILPLRDYLRLRSLTRKTHVKIRILKKGGVYNFKKYRVFFLLLALLMLGSISAVLEYHSRIWSFCIEGNQHLSDDTIRRYLRSHKIDLGISRQKIDYDQLEHDLRIHFETLIWVSVSSEDTTLFIQVREGLPLPRHKNSATNYDIVAGCDATIRSIITRSGSPKVVADEKVHAGQLLVSASQELLDDNLEVKEYYNRSADADIIGEYLLPYKEDLSEQEICHNRTGNSKKYYRLCVGDRLYSLPDPRAHYRHFTAVQEERSLFFLRIPLPLSFVCITEYETDPIIYSRKKEEIRSLALAHLQEFCDNLDNYGIEILEKNVMMKNQKGQYHIYGFLKVRSEIGRKIKSKEVSKGIKQ